MATIQPTGDFRQLLGSQQLHELEQAIKAEQQRDDGVAYTMDYSQPDWSTYRSVQDGNPPVQPIGQVVGEPHAGQLVGIASWGTAIPEQWIETTASDHTTPYPTREFPVQRQQTYRLLADGTLEVVDAQGNGTVVNPVQQLPPLPYGVDVDDLRFQQLNRQLEELNRQVAELTTKLNQQQPDVEKSDNKSASRRLVI